MTADPGQFAAALLAWFEEHGRTDLPWQEDRDPYRVWVSEIMLQQTQVATVIDYFTRFMGRFPTLVDLANARDDEVMESWAGLGYYSRARNLKKAARICRDEHAGKVPEAFDALLALPGIGRSTAGAILAQAHGKRYPILDGNVKRVLARLHGIEEWPGKSAVGRRLWDLADSYTPSERVADYTQAIMDLGATLCTPRNPGCPVCPVAAMCDAYRQDRVDRCPGPRPKKERPERHRFALLQVDSGGRVLLERRPPSGIWGSLWALPMREDLSETGSAYPMAEPIRHGFTHFRMVLTPVLIETGETPPIMDTEARWVTAEDFRALGLPKPMKRLLEDYFKDRLAWQEQFIA